MPIQDPSIRAIEALKELASSHESSAEFYHSTRSLVESKLYHQLTVQILAFTSSFENYHAFQQQQEQQDEAMMSHDSMTDSNPNEHQRNDTTLTMSPNSNFLQLYQILIIFSSKLDPLMLARIAWNVTHATLLSHCTNTATTTTSAEEEHAAASQKLSSLLSQLSQSPEIQSVPHAHLYTCAKLHLVPLLLPLSPSVATSWVSWQTPIREFLSQFAPLLPQLASSASTASATSASLAIALSAYHETAMELYRCIGLDTCSESFYHAAIEYLHYAPPGSGMDLGEKGRESAMRLARDLILAALIAPRVYNLGQVVYENDALLQVLDGTEWGYLKDLMVAAAQGDVNGSMEILKGHLRELEDLYHHNNKKQKNAVAAVAGGGLADIMREKIILLGLVHMVFERESHERQMAFDDIAQRLNVDVDQVEWICMKAISKGLMKGSMDQVDGVVDVTWVMPRVLDESMMKNLANRLGDWKDKVSEMKDYMKDHVAAF